MPVAPPMIPVFPAGYGPLPADMTNWIQNSFIFQTTGIVFRAEQHTAQTFTGGTTTTINFDTVLEDPYLGWNAVQHLWLAPYTGWYEVTVTATHGSLVNTSAAYVISPEVVLRCSQQLESATYPGMCAASVIFPLIGGVDSIGAQINVSSTTTANTTVGRFSSLEICFISQ